MPEAARASSSNPVERVPPRPDLFLDLVVFFLLSSTAALFIVLAFFNVFDDILHFGGEVISVHVGYDSGIVFGIGKVQIVHVGQFAHNASILRLDQHIEVPLSQPIVFGRFLIFRFGV